MSKQCFYCGKPTEWTSFTKLHGKRAVCAKHLAKAQRQEIRRNRWARRWFKIKRFFGV